MQIDQRCSYNLYLDCSHTYIYSDTMLIMGLLAYSNYTVSMLDSEQILIVILNCEVHI